MARSGASTSRRTTSRNAMPEPVPGSPPGNALGAGRSTAAIGAVATVIGVLAVSLVARPPSSTAGTLPAPTVAPSAPATTATATAQAGPSRRRSSPPSLTRCSSRSRPATPRFSVTARTWGLSPSCSTWPTARRHRCRSAARATSRRASSSTGEDARVAFSLDSATAAPAGPAKPAGGGGPKFGGIDDVGGPLREALADLPEAVGCPWQGQPLAIPEDVGCPN